MRRPALLPLLFCFALGACAGSLDNTAPEPALPDAAVVVAPDASAPPPLSPEIRPDAGLVDELPEDDAVVMQGSFPSKLTCGESATATLVMQNSGVAAWDDAYRLGVVGDTNPLGDTRVHLPQGIAIAPGKSFSFTVSLTAPAMAGAYTLRFRMVHENVRWFGESRDAVLTVECAPPKGPDAIDLGKAVFLNNPPDLASWPVTTLITRLDIAPSGIHVEFSKRDGAGRWPDITPPGWDGPLQYTLGMALDIGGTWYASAPIQFWYGLEESGGPPGDVATNWFYDPNRWAPMTTHQPAPGERVGFFVVAGNVRNVTDGSQSPVRERSNVVVVAYPGSGGASFTFP